MEDIEETVEQVLSDVKKLETQIEALLNSLKNNVTIVEADLVPFTLSPPKVSSRSAKQYDDARDVPMEVNDHGPKDVNPKEKAEFRGGFVPLDSEMFLVPVLDKWVFGIVLVNKSNRPLCHPDLLLTMVSKIQKIQLSTFSYNVRMSMLGVNLENMFSINRVPFGIPYQDSMAVAHDDLQLGEVQMVQSSCKILMTACFDHPIQFCDDSNEFTLLVSICSGGGLHLLSRSLKANYTNLTSRYNEETLNKHNVNLPVALSTFQDSFNLNYLKSSEHYNLKSFYSQLGFKKIKSETTENDALVDTLTPNFYSVFTGSMFKVEKWSNIRNTVRCVISTRSAEQMQIFYNHLYKWIQDRQCNMPTLKITSSHVKNSNDLSKVLSNETTHLLKLIHFSYKGLGSEASSKKDLQWMKEYYRCLVYTDTVLRDIYL